VRGAGVVAVRRLRETGWLLLAVAITAGAVGGCGSGGAAPPRQAVVSPSVGEERQQIMAGVFDLLETVGMTYWADYGRQFLHTGRILPADFSTKTANRFGLSGYDAIAHLPEGRIYVDVTTWTGMPPRMLATVMLDELCHFYFNTSNHEDYYRLDRELRRAWSARYGRPFSEIGPGDEVYLEWWRRFAPKAYHRWQKQQTPEP
jgi:hypothetical protein